MNRSERRTRCETSPTAISAFGSGFGYFAYRLSVCFGEAYPIRTITVVVPFAAGGATDITARIIAEHMSRTLGQQLRVENVVGAGGTTGTTRAMRANPDGYTIMMGQLGTHALSVALYPDLAYKPDVDFSPIGRLWTRRW